MHLEFQGAARTVTGSMHVLAVGGRTILLDCGIFHGRREESRERNSKFPFDPASVEAVILSHAHIDHSGNIPRLVRLGFRGRIYCTHATRSLCDVMLRDSAYIQERDAEFISKRHRTKGLPPIEPLYVPEDVEMSLPLFHGVDYSTPVEIAEGVECRFEDAGHILGSASLALTVRENGRTVRLGFTGDLGRKNLPILRDPVFIGDGEEFHYVISESTYGGRFHAPVTDMGSQLLEPLRRACDRKGRIVIPAFSVGRTQELVYMMHELSLAGKLPPMPIFVDSPLSVNITEVFRRHPECYDRETRAMLESEDDAFGFGRVDYIKNVNESKELNDREGPFVVISASGMCEAGRVVHHLANTVGDPRAMVLIVGYQAENTLGKKLVMREPTVRIFGEPREVRAEVVVLNSFSAHADRNELVGYAGQFPVQSVREIFLVHGDADQADKLRSGLLEHGFRRVSVPARGDRAPLR
jgi:metallo-beta-lactamase family protein